MCTTGNTVPLTGPPSINSNFARVSVSTYVLGPDPVDSRLLISSSIFLILILTRRKYILPRITSFRWYLYIFKLKLTTVFFENIEINPLNMSLLKLTCFYCTQIRCVSNPQFLLPSAWRNNIQHA